MRCKKSTHSTATMNTMDRFTFFFQVMLRRQITNWGMAKIMKSEPLLWAVATAFKTRRSTTQEPSVMRGSQDLAIGEQENISRNVMIT